MADNTSLNEAARAKKDKFYTQLTDIQNELYYYREMFRDKVILCNCDDPYESWFFKYFAMNFNGLGLKKLITTSYADSPIAGTELVLEGFADKGKKAFIYEVDELCDWNGDGRKDLDDVEFAIQNGIYKCTELTGDENYCAGDFRSKECIALLPQADIVVTNPPFSVFREFVAQMIQYDKKFIIIGNVNAITYKEIFPLIMQNKLWLGVSISSGDREFQIPEDYPLTAANYRVDEEGTKFIRVKGVRWFTNLDHKRRHDTIPIFREYYKNPEMFPHYDNYDAIEVSKTADIPCDYYGVMGVPITFLDKYCPSQFEIIGMAKRGAGDPALKSKVYTIEDYPNYSDLNAGPVLIKNGVPKNTYPRILIRRRQK